MCEWSPLDGIWYLHIYLFTHLHIYYLDAEAEDEGLDECVVCPGLEGAAYGFGEADAFFVGGGVDVDAYFGEGGGCVVAVAFVGDGFEFVAVVADVGEGGLIGCYGEDFGDAIAE